MLRESVEMQNQNEFTNIARGIVRRLFNEMTRDTMKNDKNFSFIS